VSVSDAVSITLAVLSLVVAGYTAGKQYLLQKRSVNVPVVMEILTSFRDPQLHASLEAVTRNLPHADPSKGLGGLKPELRNHVFNVAYFFQMVAGLVLMDLADARVFTTLLRARLISTWTAMEPFIIREREINPSTGPEFLTLYEAFAIKASATGPEVGQAILRRWMAGEPPL
jgi:hypothetical protein